MPTPRRRLRNFTGCAFATLLALSGCSGRVDLLPGHVDPPREPSDASTTAGANSGAGPAGAANAAGQSGVDAGGTESIGGENTSGIGGEADGVGGEAGGVGGDNGSVAGQANDVGGEAGGGQGAGGGNGEAGGAGGGGGGGGDASGGEAGGGGEAGDGGGTCVCITTRVWVDNTVVPGQVVTGDCFTVAGQTYAFTGSAMSTFYANQACNPAHPMSWCPSNNFVFVACD